MIDVDYLNELRRLEITQMIGLIPNGARVLEFGAGTGEQARFLADHGFDVAAIDLASSDYAGERVFPVQDYDGRKIPLGDQSIDVIFSSNVLEHVENLPEIMSEFRRVLRPGGFAVHAVPTFWWRLWTFASAPPAAAQAAARLVRDIAPPPSQPAASFLQRLKAVVAPLVPVGHGTSAEGFSELWRFSAPAWRRRFRRNGWDVVDARPVGIFYTGNVVFGLSLPFERRQKLSRMLGSGAQVFVVRPADASR